LKSEGIVQTTFSYLPRVAIKFLELAGAGLASAIAAYLLAHIGMPPASSMPLVEITAANAEMIRMVRDEHALLAELGKELDVQRKPEQVAAALMPVPASKPTKRAQATPLRNQKTERIMPMEPKPRTGEPLPIESAVGVSQYSPRIMEPSPQTVDPGAAARPIRVSASTNADGELSSLGMLKRIHGWFLPENGDAPRPPMPVGEFPQSAM
jgi:hypothetical protein